MFGVAIVVMKVTTLKFQHKFFFRNIAIHWELSGTNLEFITGGKLVYNTCFQLQFFEG